MSDDDKVVPLRAVEIVSDIPAFLRQQADLLEKGDPSWPVSTAVVVLVGEREYPAPAGSIVRTECSVASQGPRHSVLDTVGALAYAQLDLYGIGER